MLQIVGVLGKSLASFVKYSRIQWGGKGNMNMTIIGLGQTRATRTLRTSGEIPKYQDTPKVRKIIVSILSSFCVGHHKIVLRYIIMHCFSNVAIWMANLESTFIYLVLCLLMYVVLMPPAVAQRAVLSVRVGDGVLQIFPTTLNNFSFLDSPVVFLLKEGPGYLCCFGLLAKFFSCFVFF